MAAKLIRDDLLESERVHKVPVEARWLYVTALLMADDVGLFEVNLFKLSRRSGIPQEHINSLLKSLALVDLVRPYEHGKKAYFFIPRYKQRLQIKRAKCPLPPQELLHGDEDAASKIKHLLSISRMATESNGKTPLEPEPKPKPKKRTSPPASRGPLAASAVCGYCRVQQGQVNQAFELDHFTPVAAGGPDEAPNRVLCCHTCNQIKGARIFRDMEQASAFIHATLWGKNRARYAEPRKVCFGGQPPAGFVATIGVAELKAEGVDEVVAQDWLRVRKEKKAPLTETAWASVKREAQLAKLTPAQAVKMAAENSWQGFKASWVDRPTTKGRQPTESNFARERRERVHSLTGGLVSRRAPNDPDTLEMIDDFPQAPKLLG